MLPSPSFMPGTTNLELILIESGGDSLSAMFSPELAPHVGASLDLMQRENMRIHGSMFIIFSALRHGTGATQIAAMIAEMGGLTAA